MQKLPRSFFNRPTLTVAQKLLGKNLVFNGQSGIITETEAYIGENDPACHAARGLTPRTKVMFGPAGHAYVYLIYGMYFCLNFVTERKGFPAAVLIRGVRTNDKYLDGPGKLCKGLGITKTHNGIDICGSEDFFVRDSNYRPRFEVAPRIGIKVGVDKMWRFLSE